jgi:hypothetical protein
VRHRGQMSDWRKLGRQDNDDTLALWAEMQTELVPPENVLRQWFSSIIRRIREAIA